MSDPVSTCSLFGPPSIAEVRAHARWVLLRSKRMEFPSGALAVEDTLQTRPPQEWANAKDGIPNKYVHSQLQSETAEWIRATGFNVMVTLTFASEAGVSHSLATRIFGQFLKRFRSIAVRKGSTKKIPIAPVIEDSKEQLREQGRSLGEREGTHIDVLMKLRGRDPYALKNKVLETWKNTNRLCGDPLVSCPNSDKWFLPISDDQMLARCTSYILKRQELDSLGLLVQYVHLD